MKFTNPVRVSRLLALAALLVVFSIRADDHQSAAALAAYEDGNYKLAMQSFVSAIQADPENSHLHHWLGKCYGRLGRTEQLVQVHVLCQKNPETVPQGCRT